jgi:hypothetical protein
MLLLTPSEQKPSTISTRSLEHSLAAPGPVVHFLWSWEVAEHDVLSKLARAQGGVRPHRGITVIPTCGAAPTPVMPQVRRTWGRAESREKPQVEP